MTIKKKTKILLKPNTPTTSITCNLKPSNDPGLWKINDAMSDYLVKYGFNQNKYGDFIKLSKVWLNDQKYQLSKVW